MKFPNYMVIVFLLLGVSNIQSFSSIGLNNVQSLKPKNWLISQKEKNQYLWRKKGTVTDDSMDYVKINVISSTKNQPLENEPPSVELLTLTLEKLKTQRELRRQEFLATEIAVQKTEAELDKLLRNNSSPLTRSYNYGFISKSTGSINTGVLNKAGEAVPANALFLALDNFKRELRNLLDSFNPSNNIFNSTETDEGILKLRKLKLSNDAIWAREAKRKQIKAPLLIKIPYYILCLLLDELFDGAPISRFYFLETVARMPYFSYITMLHTYETLGWWRRSTEAKRVHFAEEYNEFHHLLIWESLGGDQEWKVRFFAQHSAIIYFFVLIIMWIASPSLAYNFSELIEAHAVDTYAEFADANKELLQSMEAPDVAKSYYEAADMYVFDEFQTNRVKGSRRPKINTLYDVVCNIRDDEAEHVATMAACQDPEVAIRSPNTEAALLASATAAILSLGIINSVLPEEGFISNVLSSNSMAEDVAQFINGAIKRIKDGSIEGVSLTATQAINNINNEGVGNTAMKDAIDNVINTGGGGGETMKETIFGRLIKLISSIRF